MKEKDIYTQNLENALSIFQVAVQKFITKVETGNAHSKETYRDLKHALEYSKNIIKD